MTRRTLLSLPAAAAVLRGQQREGLIKPRHLENGDAVALISPSTDVIEPDTLLLAEKTVEFLGLKPLRSKFSGVRPSTFADSVRNRLADFHDAWRDPQVKGIFAIRGGYGAQQILDGIDFDLVRRSPKVFVGYSDITALHLALHQRTGLVTFHGPVALSAFTPYTLAAFRKALFEPAPIGELTTPNELSHRPQHTLRAIRAGTARGRLTGGNLSLINATMGTPYEVQSKGKLFFIEDVGEEPYRIDRMLMQLRHSRKLQDAAGVIWGECNDCRPKRFEPSFASQYGLGETIDNLFQDVGVPVLAGLTIGHTADQLTLPLGVMARLDAAKGTLTIEEAATL